jgi:sigma-B regulation protein RsbU (phosphoserine phosphatase)
VTSIVDPPADPHDAAAVEAMLTETRTLLHADTATILLLDTSRTGLEPFVSVGLDRTSRLAPRIPLGQGFAGRVALLGEPVVIDHVTPDNVINPVLRSHGVESLLGVPLLADGQVMGVVHVGSRARRRFDDTDVATLTSTARQLASAIVARARDDEHAAAYVLQRSLLPSQPVTVPGLEIAARYLPAEGDLGGDWYDVFTLPDGRLGIVMGDVVGHGLNAAVVMGRIRSALRAYALDHDDPAEVLSRLDRKISHFETGALATVVYGIADPPYRTFRFSSAGHWPPVMVGPGTSDVDATIRSEVMLGVRPGSTRTTTHLQLAPGAVMCLYTDGLVERRTADPGIDPLHAGLERLNAALDESLDAESNVASVIGSLLAQDIIDDDVAILVIKAV